MRCQLQHHGLNEASLKLETKSLRRAQRTHLGPSDRLGRMNSHTCRRLVRGLINTEPRRTQITGSV